MVRFSTVADSQAQPRVGHGWQSATIAPCQDENLDSGAALAERLDDGGDGQGRAAALDRVDDVGNAHALLVR